MLVSRYGRRHWAGLARRVARRRSPLSRLAVQSDQGAGDFGRRRVGRTVDRRRGERLGGRCHDQGFGRPACGAPLDDAQKAIADVITGSESERQKKAKLIFAGLFKTLNDERSDVMRGIERYARKQREFSDQIRSTILQLRELQDRPDADQGRIDELTNRVEWDTRIFEERRKTMSFVCEVPVLIEQRLFALARAIQQSLE
jgi:hypothetical protein